MLEHTKEAKKFYNSARWKKCRSSYIQSVFGLCERCQCPGDIVHHKVYIDSKNLDDAYVTLNHDNLEYLCLVCHNKEHFAKYSSTREGLMFDDKGNLIQA